MFCAGSACHHARLLMLTCDSSLRLCANMAAHSTCAACVRSFCLHTLRSRLQHPASHAHVRYTASNTALPSNASVTPPPLPPPFPNPNSAVSRNSTSLDSAKQTVCVKSSTLDGSNNPEGISAIDESPFYDGGVKGKQADKGANQSFGASSDVVSAPFVPPRVPQRSLWIRVVDEIKHFYHGFRLLFIEIRISCRLVGRILLGNVLTRREHRQLIRTVADLFRLVPFSVFIIIPFMEFLLPVFIKLFPNMLPSTFQTDNDKEANIKRRLKVKLETAKFLQQTLDSMAFQGKGHHSENAREFADFCNQIRSTGEQATNEQILRFSQLFHDEITLDSLARAQLVALCRVLEINTFGPSNVLRFAIRMKLRHLAADDREIFREGVDLMTVSELQSAVRARGMRSLGVPEDRLRYQLQQWIDLSLNEKVPPSLLLLSRALYLSESLPAEDQLKETLSRLPESASTAARAVIGEREGRVDYKTRVDIVREEERRIREERDELADLAPEIVTQPGQVSEDSDLATVGADRGDKEVEISAQEVMAIEDAIQTLSSSEGRKPLLELAELEDIKEELLEYQEDVEELSTQTRQAADSLKETRAARRLYTGVNRLIESVDELVERLETRRSNLLTLSSDTRGRHCDDVIAQNEERVISIDSLIGALRQLQTVSDTKKLQIISDLLETIDVDKDRQILVKDVYNVIELLGTSDNVKLSASHLREIVDLLDREKVIELEDKIERALVREVASTAAPSTENLRTSNSDQSADHVTVSGKSGPKVT